ncbi:hypothetical protein [Salmonirosea aquatica]|uniref:Tryptophan-rich sensory protein n=1 Tax=Salmonirosea aquatica TaxID=2654236 RepID=A0A7C9FZG7_9BACT|nr:hypothetical protein [Cytophagaceae bacterium SJW1-29]
MDSKLIPTALSASIKTWQVLNIIGFFIMLTLNFLANYLPLNGKTTGELSDQYPNLFVPSGATFSIWGVIYILLLIFTIYQASTLFSAKASRVNTMVQKIGVWYFASSLLNASWIVAWHYELVPVSVAIMLVLLFSLLVVNFGIYNGSDFLNPGERFVTKAPFGVYLGWICVATIANVTTWLTGIGWNGGLEDDTWAVLMIAIGGIIAFIAASRLHNGYLALAVVWAFGGIISKRLGQEPIYYSIVFVAGVAALLLFVYGLVALTRDFKSQQVTYPEPSNLYQ